MNPPSDADAALGDLLSLRAEIDRVDDAIHDLLMRRAEIVERVGNSRDKAGSGIALRPGREAAIIRRLLARHRGRLPPQVLVRLWRELLAGTTSMQRPFAVAVCDDDPLRSYTQAAREHFGALTPLRTHASTAEALADISAGRASAAVLPMPANSNSGQPDLRSDWWITLMRSNEAGLHIIARLPFWSARPEGAPAVEALVVAPIAPDESGDDRTLVGLELEGRASAAEVSAALRGTDLVADCLVMRGDPERGMVRALAELPGFIKGDDPRLSKMEPRVRRAVVLGGYARPIGFKENAR